MADPPKGKLAKKQDSRNSRLISYIVSFCYRLLFDHTTP